MMLMITNWTPVLLFSIVCGVYSGSYKFQNKQNLGTDATCFAFAPKSVQPSILNKTVNLIVGYQNGSILLTDVNNFNTRLALPLSNETINKAEWNDAAIWITSNSSVYILDQNSMQIKMNISSSSEKILQTAQGYRKIGTSSILLTAVCLSNEVRIYQDTKLVLNYSIKAFCKAMAFDTKGIFFYYFDNQSRYIVNVQNRSLNGSYYVSYNHNVAVSGKKSNGYQFYASVDVNGYMCVWDYQSIINRYDPANQSIIRISENYQYVLTYRTNNTLLVWQTSLENSDNWKKIQQINTNSTITPKSMQIKQLKLLYLLNDSLYNYYYSNTNDDDDKPDGDGGSYIYLYIIGGAVAAAVVILIIYLKCKREWTCQKCCIQFCCCLTCCHIVDFQKIEKQKLKQQGYL